MNQIFTENDLYDIVRNCDDEDSIEDVSQIDVFTHPKSGKVWPGFEMHD